MDSGLDSLGAVELSSSISGAFGIHLPPTFMFDYPTTATMAAYVVDHLHRGQSGRTANIASVPAHDAFVSAVPGQLTPKIAQGQGQVSQIAGMACRYPGGAVSPAEFWEIALGEGDVQTTVPRERWDIDKVYAPDAVPGKMSMYSR